MPQNDNFGQIFSLKAHFGLLTLTNCLRRAGCPYDRASTYYMMIEARLLDSRREFTKRLAEKLIHTLQKMMILNMMIMTERLIHTLKEVLFVLLISMAVEEILTKKSTKTIKA